VTNDALTGKRRGNNLKNFLPSADYVLKTVFVVLFKGLLAES